MANDNGSTPATFAAPPLLGAMRGGDEMGGTEERPEGMPDAACGRRCMRDCIGLWNEDEEAEYRDRRSPS